MGSSLGQAASGRAGSWEAPRGERWAGGEVQSGEARTFKAEKLEGGEIDEELGVLAHLRARVRPNIHGAKQLRHVLVGGDRVKLPREQIEYQHLRRTARPRREGRGQAA